MPDQTHYHANQHLVKQHAAHQPRGVYSQYLEAEVLSADPIKLVTLLYRGALDAVASARAHLKNGDIRQRTRRINQAYEIIFELIHSLDHSVGGEISRNLARLYAYMQSKLLEANSQQIEPPLIEVETLLTTLAEAWKAVPAGEHAADRPASSDAEYVPVSCTY